MPTNDLYTLYDAVQDTATAKQKPQSLTEDLYGQYAYDPYVKEESVVNTYEKVQGVKISLNKSTETVTVGANKTLVATVSPASVGTPTWSSSNTANATVNASGEVTGIKAGTAIITATVAGKSATCNVTVNAAQSNP